jgi:hypothetical protein
MEKGGWQVEEGEDRTQKTNRMRGRRRRRTTTREGGEEM